MNYSETRLDRLTVCVLRLQHWGSACDVAGEQTVLPWICSKGDEQIWVLK